MTIRTKLQAILIVLFVFIIGLVGLNFSTFNELKGDSPAVNASGSLRMRAYQLSWLSARLVSADEEQAAALRKTMQEYITAYDRILAGLEKGDAELNLLPVEDAAVQQQLAAVKPLWESYRSDVRAVSDAADEEMRRTADAKVAGEVASYVAEVNKLVAAYDAASQAKIAMSKDIQLGGHRSCAVHRRRCALAASRADSAPPCSTDQIIQRDRRRRRGFNTAAACREGRRDWTDRPLLQYLYRQAAYDHARCTGERC